MHNTHYGFLKYRKVTPIASWVWRDHAATPAALMLCIMHFSNFIYIHFIMYIETCLSLLLSMQQYLQEKKKKKTEKQVDLLANVRYVYLSAFK